MLGLSLINYIRNKIAKNVGILKRLKYRLPGKLLNTLYNTLILPYLNYCNIIWANNKSSRLQPLFKLQKRSMRIINNSPYNTHALPLFSKLNQLTIFDLNKLSIATLMFRHYKNCLPNIFAHYFCTNSTIHSHDTRNAINPQTPKVFRQPKTSKGGGGLMQPPCIFAFPSEFFENIYHGYVFGVKESNGDNEKILSLLHDLENQGQTPFCMTFLISGCKHDTKLILVSILTFSRSRISNMLKKIM